MDPLVLLPGILSDEAVWAHQIAHIPNTMVPRLEADTPEGMVEAVMAVAPPTFALAGHSMGGWVALEVMKRHPERISKLCIIATTADVDPEEVANARRAWIASFDDTVIDMLVEHLTFIESAKKDVREMFRRNRSAFVPQQTAILARASSLSLLPTITQSTLVIGASKDVRFLESTKEIARHIPNAHLEIVQESGHMVTMEQPETVTQLMQGWLFDQQSG